MSLGMGQITCLVHKIFVFPVPLKVSFFQVFIDSICSSTIFSSSAIFLWDSSKILGVVNLSFSNILGNKPCNLYFNHMPCTIGYPTESIVYHHLCKQILIYWLLSMDALMNRHHMPTTLFIWCLITNYTTLCI